MLAVGIIHHLSWMGFPWILNEPQQRKSERIICASRPDAARAGRAMTQKTGSDSQSERMG